MRSAESFTPVTQLDGTTRPAEARSLLRTEEVRYGWYALDPDYDDAKPEGDEDEELGISADPIVVALDGLAVSFTETARAVVNQHVYPPETLEFTAAPSAEMTTLVVINADKASANVLDAIHFAARPAAPDYETRQAA